MANEGTSNRGFASMDEDKQRDVASKGGRSVPDQERSFSQDRQLAAEAGREGGQQSGGQDHAGNASRGGQQRAEDAGQSDNRQQGGSGNFADDRERASEAGRKGGQS